jgi:hypothetical protein
MKAEEADKPQGLGLCYRCEHRARFLETGDHPRFECGMEKTASHCCYCFIPCKPIAVGPIKGEKRPIFAGWMFAGRIQSYGLVADERIRLKLIGLGDGKVSATWTIKPIKNNKLLRRHSS